MMGARIVVQSGISADSVFWIEKNVVRIGSDPDMDLTIPSDELEKHALTVEFRGNGYRVHNRCSVPVYLGGRTVSPSQSDQWLDTDLLELPGAIQLAMEFEGEPVPAPAPAVGRSQHAERVDELAPQASRKEQSTASARRAVMSAAPSNQKANVSGVATKPSSTMLQVGVIIFCVLGCALLLAYDRTRGKTRAADVPEFAQIVGLGLKQNDPAARKLLQHLQYAEAAMIRGNESVARERFANVRSLLLTNANSANRPPTIGEPELEQQMMQWVEYRLAQL